MKTFLVLILAIIMVLSVVACKNEPEQSGEASANVSKEQGKDNLIAQGAKSGAKDINLKGFRVIGTYEVSGSKVAIEIGGKDGVYWVGTDDENDDGIIDNWEFFSEVKNNDNTYTLKFYDAENSVWDAYTIDSSLKDAIFGVLADQILYCSFALEKSFPGFTTAVAAGTTTKDSRACSKYTASWSFELPESLTNPQKTKNVKIFDATLYVDNEFAITLAVELSISEEFKNYVKQNYQLSSDESIQELINSMDFFKYNATVDFDLSASDLASVTGYSAAVAKL